MTATQAVDVVIGAGSAMGAAAARAIASDRSLLLTDRNPDTIEQTAATIDADMTCAVCDVTDPAAVAAFLTSSDASFMTGCDVLVDGGGSASNPQ